MAINVKHTHWYTFPQNLFSKSLSLNKISTPVLPVNQPFQFSSVSRFFNFSTTDIQDQIILGCKRTISGLYSEVTSISRLVVTTEHVFRHCQMSSSGETLHGSHCAKWNGCFGIRWHLQSNSESSLSLILMFLPLTYPLGTQMPLFIAFKIFIIIYFELQIFPLLL